MAYIIIKDKKDNRTKKKRGKTHSYINVLYIGELLYEDCKKEFEEFYNLYLTDKKQIKTKDQLNLQDNSSKYKQLGDLSYFDI